MCGIVGFLAGGDLTHNKDRADFIETALYTDAVRGMHATGLFTVERNGRPFFSKDAVDAMRFLDSRGAYNYVRTTAHGTRACIGHNRYATKGGLEREAAHPFVTTNVVMVHNGTLHDYAWMPEHKKADSDSARLAMALSEADPGDVDLWKRVRGAYAVVWYDGRDGMLRIVRNEDRPLHYICNLKHAFIASEAKMLEWLVCPERLNIITEKGVRAKQFKPHTIYAWQVDKGRFEVSKPKRTTYTPTPPPKTYSNRGGFGGWTGGYPSNSADEAWRDNFSLAYYNKDGRRIKAAETKTEAQTQEEKVNYTIANSLFEKMGWKVRCGDIIEVMSGGLVEYHKNKGYSFCQGWLEDDEVEHIGAENFKYQVFADVHNVTIQKTKLARVDSYYAVVKGVYDGMSDWMSKNDVMLLCDYVEAAAREEPWRWWKTESLKKFFHEHRLRYNINDSAKYKFGKDLVTRREFDLLVQETKCDACKILSSLVPREEIFPSVDGDVWYCKTCCDKALNAAMEDELDEQDGPGNAVLVDQHGNVIH